MIRMRGAGRVVVLAAALLQVACGKGDPEKIRQNLHLPADDFIADSNRGRVAYLSSCARCHGKGGAGTRLGPSLVHKTYRPSHHPDIAFHLAVKNGVRQHHWNFGHMPPVEDLAPEDVGDIIAYIRAEQRRAGIQ